MRIVCLPAVLLSTLLAAHPALAQADPAPASAPPSSVTPQSPAPAPSPMPARPRTATAEDQGEAAMPFSASKVPMSAPVITVMGVCDNYKTAPKAECKTVVTRAEFETLVKGLEPNMPPARRKQLANAYSELLAAAQEAHKRGLDKTPEYQAAIGFIRLEILARQLGSTQHAEAAKVSANEIQEYYDKNKAAFEAVTLDSIFVPKTRAFDIVKDDPNNPATRKEAEDIMKKEADELRQRAAAGEAFEKLQKEAYETARMTASPPPVTQTDLRRNALPYNLAAALDLPAGEVSPVYNDPRGYFIYKVESRYPAPLATVRDEVRPLVQEMHLRDDQQKLRDSVNASLNEAYFGKPGAPGGRPPLGMQGGVSRRPGAEVVPSPRGPMPLQVPPPSPQ